MAEQYLDGGMPIVANRLDLGADITFFEFDDFYRITADLHGLSLEEISVALHPGMLTIAGDRQLGPSQDRDDGGDRFSGSFSYNIGLPTDVDEAEVRGAFDHGTLILTLGRRIHYC